MTHNSHDHDGEDDLDLIDPTPDVHDLFVYYNARYFHQALAPCQVSWSKRMTLCAGLCSYDRRTKYCSIRLSEPLLKYRPRTDLINTLLHEMIHAYLFVTENNTDRESHGPQFQAHMARLNQAEGTSITIYHTFNDEVDFHRTHVWQCNGPCRFQPPYFGIVKRSMNRPPQKADWWFENHQRSCGGTYAKIQEPPKNESRRKPKQAKRESGVPGHQATLDSFVSVSKNSSSSGPSRDAAGHRADSPQRTAQVIDLDGDECDHEASPMQRVACPVCGHDGFSLDSINVHIDSCLGTA